MTPATKLRRPAAEGGNAKGGNKSLADKEDESEIRKAIDLIPDSGHSMPDEDTSNPGGPQLHLVAVPERLIKVETESWQLPELSSLPWPQLELMSSDHQACVNGLVNVGFSCYINVILQGLACTPGLKEYFFHSLHLKEFSETKKPIVSRAFAGRVGEFLQLYHSYNDHVMYPAKLIELVANESNVFNPTSCQDDAHEFLLYSLDRLASELNRNL